MRHITKHKSPEDFTAWKTKYSQTQRRPATYRALVKHTSMKHLVQTSLIVEQHYTCCYCGNRIDICDSHIDHFLPQSEFRQQQLTYTNLHASCQFTDSCGHAKNREYRDILSPLMTDCESYFRYREDGKIEPTGTVGGVDKHRIAANTLDKLGLDGERLRVLRRAAISGAIELTDLSDEELEALMISYSEPDACGKYEPFSAAILDVLRQMHYERPGNSMSD